MKRFGILLICGSTLLTAGCRSPVVMQTPVGPAPAARETGGPNGHLLVFSAKEARGDGDDPTYYQHSDYAVYDLHGKRIAAVDNTTGFFSEAPRDVQLPPGMYTLKAQAEDSGWVELPVVVKEGRTTVVHLDKASKLSSSRQDTEFVTLPDGYLVGWSASPSEPADAQ